MKNILILICFCLCTSRCLAQNFKINTNRNLAGIGITFQINEDTLLVTSILIGGPSDKAGLRKLDQIIEIDGKSIIGVGITTNGIRKKLVGESGIKVHLLVIRDRQDTLIFDVLRELIPNLKISDDTLRLVKPIGHTGSINSVVFSPDGKLFLSSSDDGNIHLYEAISGKQIQQYSGHIGEVYSAVFSPDMKTIISSGRDKSLRIFDIKTGLMLNCLRVDEGIIEKVLCSSKANLILTLTIVYEENLFDFSLNTVRPICSNSEIRIYDANSYQLLHKIDSKTCVNYVDFSPNGEFIIIANSDSTVRIFDIKIGKESWVYSGHNGSVHSAVFSPDGNFILTSSKDSTFHLVEINTGKKIFSYKEKNIDIDSRINLGFTQRVTKASFSPNGEYIMMFGFGKTLKIYDIKNHEFIIDFKSNSFITSAFFSPNSKLFTILNHDTVRVFEMRSRILLSEISNPNNHRINCCEFSSNSKILVCGSFNNSLYIKNLSSQRQSDVIIGKTGLENSRGFGMIESKMSCRFSLNDKYVIYDGLDTRTHLIDILTGRELLQPYDLMEYTSSSDLNSNCQLIAFSDLYGYTSVYDFKSRRNSFNYHAHSESVNSTFFSNDGKLILTASSDGTLAIFDTLNQSSYQLAAHDKALNSATFSQDDKLIVTSSDDQTAKIWELKSGKKNEYFLVLKNILDGHFDKVKSAIFSFNGKYVLTINGIEASLFNSLNGNKIWAFSPENSSWYENYNISQAKFSPDDRKLIIAFKASVYLIDVETGKLLRIFEGHRASIKSVDFSSDSKKILTSSLDGSIKIFDLETDNEIMNYNIGNLCRYASFSNNGKFVCVLGNSNVIIMELESGKPIYERIQLENNNYLVKLPNSPYYMCSKDASKMLHYVTPSLKVIGFEQLDPVYNRPDIVLDSIGKYFGGADQVLVSDYRRAWEKRIQKLDLDKEKLGKGEIAVPNAEIVDADKVEYENKSGELTFKVNANDNKYNLSRFNVYVNEVPVYGSSGVTISNLKKQKWETTINLPLNIGKNKIQVSVMNELGLENFKYPVYVNYTPEKEIVSRTHFIGIGVNNFSDSSHNLKYCVKDIEDLANAFKDEKVKPKLLKDKEVSKENILKIKQYLRDSTSVNDRVIISCSSHGMLDDSRNFYLATYDVDFEHPEKRGIPYEFLESLLDSIPARQKLLLLDACYSGENDKTELLKKELKEIEKKNDNKELIADNSKAKGILLQLEEENTNKFRKINELFVNVRNNTGSIIISAAGGQQRALEGNLGKIEIKNGAFTYSILEYLEKNKNDKKELTVNKLKQYTEKRVEEITNGKQKPTYRQETMEVDWEVR
jgi:WD40 repeat protein